MMQNYLALVDQMLRSGCFAFLILLVVDCFGFSAPLHIHARDVDTFQQPTYFSSNGCECFVLDDFCSVFCYDDNYCTQCTCNVPYKLFLPSVGKCVLDNHLLFSPEYECYEFVFPSSAILLVSNLNCKQCKGKKVINFPWSPRTRFRFIMWNQSQFLDNGDWKMLQSEEKNFKISEKNSKLFLKWNFTSTSYDKWAGLIVKLQFYCADKKKRWFYQRSRKCIIIKFNGSQSYPVTAPPSGQLTHEPITKQSTTPEHAATTSRRTTAGTTRSSRTLLLMSARPSSFLASTGSRLPSHTTPPFTDKLFNTTSEKERQESGSIKVATIVVSLVIAALILCGAVIVGLIFYTRGSRSTKPSNSTAQGGSPASQPYAVTLNPIYSPVENNTTEFFPQNNGIYEEPARDGASQECAVYESCGSLPPVYDYAEVEEAKKSTSSQDAKYDYAKINDVRPVALWLPEKNGN